MANIIAGMYVLKKKIGAGGGGIVFLGQHLRLNKTVILKADKRKLSAGQEKLRREVDLLKSLNHTYIPQVYDFVEENGIVFTVMDYIPGESLDHLIDRNEYPNQQEVLRWAKQLLEALQYLHTRPPHGILHGDIKPANIMLRPDGSICLIDYNIALALGEDGAVSIGFSRGYASPEHYGSTNLGLPETLSVSQQNEQLRALAESSKKRSKKLSEHISTSKGTSRRVIRLDVRSDIYSLGATLYHLLSRRRPAEKAEDTIPLSKDDCSIAIAEIINKSMNPDPAQRYQSAEEMLQAFLDIRKNDICMVRHRRRKKIMCAIIATFLLTGGALTFLGQRQIRQVSAAQILASNAEKMLKQGNVEGALQNSLQAVERKNKLDAPVTPEAQKALTDALGVYDLADGWKNKGTVTLSEKPIKVEISPEGSRFAVFYDFNLNIYEMADQRLLVSLPMETSALSDMSFLDEDKIVFAGQEGISLYDLEKNKVVWTGNKCTSICVSGDHTKVASVYKDETQAYIYSTEQGTLLRVCDMGKRHFQIPVNDQFEDPKTNLFALNQNGTYLAVSDSTGGVILYDVNNTEPEDMILYEESDYTEFQGEFHGDCFSYVAYGDGKSEFGTVDVINAEFLAGFESNNKLLLKAYGTDICLSEGNLLVRVDVKAGRQKELAKLQTEKIVSYFVSENGSVVVADDGSIHIFDAAATEAEVFSDENIANMVEAAGAYIVTADINTNVLRIFEKISQLEKTFFQYEATYSHDEARVDVLDSTVMLFSAHGFRIYGIDGEFRMEQELPQTDSIYDEQFVQNGQNCYLEVTWYDGTVRQYSAKDGKMLSETNIDQPSQDLFESFETEDYVFESTLHGAPNVYKKEGHKFVKTLAENAFLTYVTELSDGYVTEYINDEDERYGIYLNHNLEPVARLEGLCDVTEDSFIFDFYNGELRRTKIYTLDELIQLGKEALDGGGKEE